MFKTVYNPTDGPVRVDEEGHTLGGQEWGAVHTAEPAAKQALDEQWLVPVQMPDEPGEMSHEAWSAKTQTDLLNERHDAFQRAGQRELAEAGIAAGVLDEEAAAGMTKAELVRYLSRRAAVDPAPVEEVQEPPASRLSTGSGESSAKGREAGSKNPKKEG